MTVCARDDEDDGLNLGRSERDGRNCWIWKLLNKADIQSNDGGDELMAEDDSG